MSRVRISQLPAALEALVGHEIAADIGSSTEKLSIEQVLALVKGDVPTELDTLEKIAASIGDDPDYAGSNAAALQYLSDEVDTKATTTAVSAALALKQNIADRSMLSGMRNKIINGDFDIWQRATSQTATGYGSDDRWRNEHTGSTKTHSRQTFTLGQVDVPGNPVYFSRTVVSSVAGASNFASKSQRLEDVRKLAGTTVTLTFYAKADAAKNIAIELAQKFGTGGSPSSDVTEIGAQKVALTTSWQKFSIAIAVPSISGKTLGTNGGHSTQLTFWFDAGSSFNARTDTLGQQSGTFDIAHVSLVEGDATGEGDPFPHRSILEERVLCNRFYRRWSKESSATPYCPIGVGGMNNTTTAFIVLELVTPMRGSPSLLYSDAAHFDIEPGDYVVTAISFTSTDRITDQMDTIMLDATVTGGTANESAVLMIDQNTGWLALDAEL